MIKYLIKYIIIVLILVCICFIVYMHMHSKYEQQKTEPFSSPKESIYQPDPFMLSSTNEPCSAIKINQSSCDTYAADKHDTQFKNKVWIKDGIYVCDTQPDSTCQYEQLSEDVRSLFENGFAGKVSDKIIPQNKVTKKKKILDSSYNKLQAVYNSASKSKTEFNNELNTMFTKYCFASPYYTQRDNDNTCPKTEENSSKQQIICNNLCNLMDGVPPQPEIPFSLTALISDELQKEFPYSFVEVVPYSELGKEGNNLVFTDREYVFEFAEGSNYVHPPLVFVPEQTYFIRGPNALKNTNENETQLTLYANKPVTVIIEMWMPLTPRKVGAYTWLTKKENKWERIPMHYQSAYNALSYADKYNVEYLKALNWFKGGVFFKKFTAGEEIILKGNGGQGTGSYYVFVTTAPFSPSQSDEETLT